MIDFVESTAAESDRFHRAVGAIGSADGGRALASVPVPTCPDWTVAELTWHLAETQYFWASIVEGNLATPSAVSDLPRPDEEHLAALAREQSAHLVTELTRRAAGEPCWSWHDHGHTVGWVRRRQAHEALIHRVDAELAMEAVGAGRPSPLDEELAADGIDEMLRIMLDASETPTWARFELDGPAIGIQVPGRSWLVRLGRFVGTDPDDVDHDLPALIVDDGAQTSPDATIDGKASEIDLWLWRRGSLVTASVDGDRSAAERLQQLAVIE